MNTTKIQQPNYTANGTVYQLVIPMDIEEMIPVDDSVRLINAVMERINVCRVLPHGENRVVTQTSIQNPRLRIHERNIFQSKIRTGLPTRY